MAAIVVSFGQTWESGFGRSSKIEVGKRGMVVWVFCGEGKDSSQGSWDTWLEWNCVIVNYSSFDDQAGSVATAASAATTATGPHGSTACQGIFGFGDTAAALVNDRQVGL